MAVIENHMLVDPALQRRIIDRILAEVAAGRLGDAPAHVEHGLGLVELPEGPKRAFVRHAADAVITDAAGRVVLITRAHNPGIGRLALPGGFIDVVDGVIETPLAAAMREAVEETGIDFLYLRDGRALGKRRFDRPFDIRAAWNDPPGTSIKRGELFAVSTQGFAFFVPDLTAVRLVEGDDAAAVQVLDIAGLTAAQFAVPDHLAMIQQAWEMRDDRK